MDAVRTCGKFSQSPAALQSDVIVVAWLNDPVGARKYKANVMQAQLFQSLEEFFGNLVLQNAPKMLQKMVSQQNSAMLHPKLTYL